MALYGATTTMQRTSSGCRLLLRRAEMSGSTTPKESSGLSRTKSAPEPFDFFADEDDIMYPDKSFEKYRDQQVLEMVPARVYLRT